MSAATLGELDVLVVGSGVAGLTTALELERRGARVGLLTKDEAGVSTSEWAQGGIAVVLPDADDDEVEDHLEDTLTAGAGLCDEGAVRVLVAGAAAAVERLIELGAVLDRDVAGRLERAREGGHRRARVVHAGGAATGAEVIRALREALSRSSIEVVERVDVVDLIVEGDRCIGVDLLEDGARRRVLAGAVVLATGGVGQCFAVTTNPLGATGDGIAMALRAGVLVADLEFVQFHPTALVTATAPRPLLTEALRGDGALLVDRSGQRFVDELAPRDVVSRAIAERCGAERSDHVFLDARGMADFGRHYPSIAAILARAGLDAGSDLLPVAPAEHYLCGGVLTDLDGQSSLPGLYAVGEVACSGAQGANRLASNSLLEGLVFGARAASAVLGDARSGGGALSGSEIALEPLVLEAVVSRASVGGESSSAGVHLQQVMTEGAGVRRSRESLELAAKQLVEIAVERPAVAVDRGELELQNLLLVARAIVEAARVREESRGTHTRLDFPDRDAAMRHRLALHFEGGSDGH